MSGSVSMVDGHIDPDTNKMTPQQAIKYFEDEILMLENAPNLNGCEMRREWREQLEICKMAKQALEKQMPKKPKFYDTKFRQRGQKYGEYVTIEKAYNCPKCNCTVWKTDKSEHCEHFGQALDWSDTE